MLKIVLAQIHLISAQPKKNFENKKKFIQNAIREKQDLIVFPELSLPGYFMGDTWEQNSFLKECEYYQEKLVELSQEISIIFGNVGCDWAKKNEDGRVRKYNAAYFASKGNLFKNSKTGFYFWPKTLLPNYRGFDDSRHFYDLRKLAFEKNCLIQDLYEPIKFSKNNSSYSIGISICEDGWSEHYSFPVIEVLNKIHPHDFFVNLSCSPFSLGKKNRRKTIFSSLAQNIKTPIFYTNCVGVQNNGKTIYGFDGGTTFYAQNGNIAELLSPFEEGTANVEFKKTEENLQKVEPKLNKNKSLPTSLQDGNYYLEIQLALEYILKLCCSQWNITKAVVGVSGGIDSALSAVLMARILGKENVYLINMPSQYNSSLTKNAAKLLAQNLDCAYAIISIEESIKYSKEQLSQVIFENSSEKNIKITNFVLENIQARDRSARILAAVASALGGVFTCNANKTELTVGYCTLYGDGAGFICPLADLWKHDVYGLANFYNDFIFKKEVIPKASLEVTPSAELNNEQNVLEGKGDPLIYPYHDYLFKSWVEDWERKTPEDCLRAFLENNLEDLIGCQKNIVKKLFPTPDLFCEDLERWWKLFQGLGAVKRVQAPPIISLSKRAYGFDFREHIGEVSFTDQYYELKKSFLMYK